jgi:hypothetical protein
MLQTVTSSETLEKLISELELSDTQKSYLRSYWLAQVLSMKAQGDRFSKIYYVLNIVTILSSVLVPFLLIIGRSVYLGSIFYSAAIILSIFVAASASLQQSSSFRQRGEKYRRIAEALEEEAWQFFRLAGLYSHYLTHASAFPTFVKQNELIVQQTQKVVMNEQISYAIELDIEQEAVLQTYLDRMSGLLSREPLRFLKPDDESWRIARTWTLTTLQRLDPVRKGILLQFLYELDLIRNANESKDNFLLREANLREANLREANLREAALMEVNLNGADLSGANLSKANLSGANLSEANLSKANLSGANLSEAKLYTANLSKTNLSEAILEGANLSGADLSYADLSGANLQMVNLGRANLGYAGVTEGQLAKALLLQGAIMPDGTTHP